MSFLAQTHALSTHSSQPLQMLMAVALLPRPQVQGSCCSRKNHSRMQKQSP